MRVFVTGSTGFVGSAIVPELLNAGHQVLGLVRSDASAAALAATGAEVYRGSLEDLDSLRTAALMCDAAIHTAFIHDFANMKLSGEVDRQAIEALGSTLAGTNKPLIVTSGTALIAPGRVITEDDVRTPGARSFPRVSEEIATSLAASGVRTSAVRLPPTVHGLGDHGFVPMLIGIARQKGVSAYIGEGLNRWPAVHRADAARLYRLILETDSTAPRFHAIAEEGVPFREIAAVIGRRLNIPVVSVSPEEAGSHFGWFATFAAIDSPASSAWTREHLGWQPTQPGLISDLDQPGYFPA